MNLVLYHYDVYPKVFLGDRIQCITIQPLGKKSEFISNHSYTVQICKVKESSPKNYPERSGRSTVVTKPDENGFLRLSAYFEGEGEHFVRVYENPEEKPIFTLSVYSLFEDMAGRFPYRGDLHVHSCRSDGREGPKNVAAYNRAKGLDFTVISDHRRYYPSLEAMEAFGDLTDLAIIPGEEIHLPLNDVHYVNFGGTFSVNALVTPSKNAELGEGMEFRSLGGTAPDPMTEEEFREMIRKRSESVPREHESERLSFAVLEWIYEQVTEAEGLGIFPHPFWLHPMMQLPEDYIEFVYKNKPFDAFEVLGGSTAYSHNGFQTAFYYKMKAEGIDHPVVGSTDSHSSLEINPNGNICSTIVFAKANKRASLIEAIKDRYSVAVDTISKEYRLVGDYRWIQYGAFLMEHYFPLHDIPCRAEGYYMNRYLAGDTRAEAILRTMKGQIAEMMEKYFRFA